ncbi:MAG: asparagine synthase, partial [Blastocatellia bacterium]|nr:asparagine synthase [Blastocatellia bacterium]
SLRTLFCSKPLTEWIFSVDSELYLRGSCEKYLLKRAFEDMLPKDIVWREKRGMGVPLTSWLLGPLKNLLIKWLSPVRLASEARLNSRLAMLIATGQFSGQIQGRRIGEILWLLIIWEIWKELVLKEQQPFYHTIHQLVWNPFLLPMKLLQKRVKEEII